MELLSVSKLKGLLGADFKAISTFFSKKRVGKDINLDSNVSSLRLFFTVIHKVSGSFYIH